MEFGRYGSDVLEWELPVSVVEALLVDHAVGCRGRNIRWCTRDYEKFGEGFGEDDEMQAAPLMDKERPIIQPRAVKAKTEQRRRSVERAEVFTPSWICNKQNNLVDAAWFQNKKNRSPFNKEMDRKDGSHGWETTHGDVKFPPGVKWYDYVKANRLEVSCGEAPYITSRYDSVTGIYIEPHDRSLILRRLLKTLSQLRRHSTTHRMNSAADGALRLFNIVSAVRKLFEGATSKDPWKFHFGIYGA